MTTRAPRTGEIDGREYYFVSKEEFEQAIKNGNMLEYAKFVNNYYGTPKDKVLEQLEAAKETTIIALTANSISGMKELYLSEGFDEYLAKPIKKKNLEQIISKYFNK